MPLTPKHQAAVDLVKKFGSIRRAAQETGMSRETLRDQIKGARKADPHCLPPAGHSEHWMEETAEDPLRLERRHALRGEIGGPPIPDIAVPPEGFVIDRNGGVYDAEGRLLRQFVSSKADAGEVFEMLPGHVVKGESAYVNADGRVIGKWIKTREGDGEGLLEALQEAFATYAGCAPPIPLPSAANDDLITFYVLPDLHFGMLAWGKETGADYDLAIATEMALSTIAQLVEQSSPSRRAVFLILGDYFHANDGKSVTPGSGHKLDVDGRWSKVYSAGAMLVARMVDLVARKHAHVDIVCLPGNHDEDAAICLRVGLSMFYSNTPHIVVDHSESIAWYLRFGNCLFGATHGHTMKPDRMAMMMANDRREDWGLAPFRHIFFGHIHHESASEPAGVRCESFQSPAARDAFNARSGYRAGRSLTAITFHCVRGETGRHRVNIMTPELVA